MLYAGAIAVLFLTPGPVWVALIARALSGGFNSAWPLAFGVAIGDVLWPIIAVLGVSYLVAQFEDAMLIMRYVACVIFLFMGFVLIKNADKTLGSDSRLTRPGMLAGFLAGLAVIIGNPKAILFYMGVLPGFFDLTQITIWDVILICAISFVIPFLGNLCLGVFVGRIRVFLSSKAGVRRLNISSGCLLILVGLVIPFT
nr:LysE family translocator [Nereida sp. MMG025]